MYIYIFLQAGVKEGIRQGKAKVAAHVPGGATPEDAMDEEEEEEDQLQTVDSDHDAILYACSCLLSPDGLPDELTRMSALNCT